MIKEYIEIEEIKEYICDKVKIELENAYDKGYKQGFEDGVHDVKVSHEYEDGLKDAWECIKKLLECKTSELNTLFDTYNIGSVIANFTAQEVMAKMNKGDKIDPRLTMTLTELKASYEDITCNTCRHDGFICDECENHSMYDPRPIKEKSCKECQILEDEYCKYPDLKCSECPVKKETSMGKMNNLQEFFDAQSKAITNLTSCPIECGCQQGAELLPQYKDIKRTENKGHWIKTKDSYGNYHFTCSRCGYDIATKYAENWKDNYCANCGARMAEPQESEEDK